ncbi:MAG: hypothetical protein AMXMBFR84_10440 [Candidatus Hydrogenedentota bacterium]
MRTIASFTIVLLLVATAAWAQDEPYTSDRTLYGIADGVGLIADIHVPKGDKNGLAVIDVISGAWYSDEGKVRDHKRAGFYDVLCSRGYTVFGIWPGSRTKFTAEEMVAHLKTGIRWVKSKAPAYGCDAERIGLTGASAGGHLACLTSLQPEPEKADDKNELMKFSTDVKAVAVFFPPADFVEWVPGTPSDLSRFEDVLFGESMAGKSPEEIQAKARAISPALLPIQSPPPFLLIHGDADDMVPLSHSERMLAALKAAGGEAELIVKPGGGHPWLTINEEVVKLVDWLDAHLKK